MKRIPLQGAVDLAALAKAKTAPEKVNSPFIVDVTDQSFEQLLTCLLYTSPSPRD